MSFAAPAALWGLLALPVIVLLYMLRTRRQHVPQSTLILWQRARRDLAAQRPARRLERSLLLLMQLLAVTLLVLALARPRLALPGGEAPTVIIVDASASMQAVDEPPSRFSAAVAQAQAAAAAARGDVIVITAGPRPVVVSPPGDALAARIALGRLRPTDGPARLDQAITLALGQGRAGRPRVEVFTDRAGAPTPGVTYHVVGSASRNVGITRVAVEREAGGSLLVVQVLNAGGRPERVPVLVTLGDRRVAERTVSIAAGATASLTIPVSGAGAARIALGVDDLLAVDNVAHAVVGAPLPRVLLAGESDRVLLQALEAIPVKVAPAQRVTPEALSAADVVVLNGTPPADLPPGNYLLLGTTATNLPLGVDGTVGVGSVLRWTGRHPVMRYVDLAGVTVGEALRIVPRGGEVLAEADTPLLWAYEGEGIRALVTAFRLDQSDLPLRIAFPILLSNAVSWLGGADRIAQAGDTISIPSGAAADASVTSPDGTTTTLPASGGRVILPAVERAGLYTVRLGGRELPLAVNPVGEESVIAPMWARAERPEAEQRHIGGQRDVGQIVLLVVLVVLILEWWLWLRTLPHIPRWGAPPHVLRRRGSHG